MFVRLFSTHFMQNIYIFGDLLIFYGFPFADLVADSLYTGSDTWIPLEIVQKMAVIYLLLTIFQRKKT